MPLVSFHPPPCGFFSARPSRFNDRRHCARSPTTRSAYISTRTGAWVQRERPARRRAAPDRPAPRGRRRGPCSTPASGTGRPATAPRRPLPFRVHHQHRPAVAMDRHVRSHLHAGRDNMRLLRRRRPAVGAGERLRHAACDIALEDALHVEQESGTRRRPRGVARSQGVGQQPAQVEQRPIALRQPIRLGRGEYVRRQRRRRHFLETAQRQQQGFAHAPRRAATTPAVARPSPWAPGCKARRP